MLTFKLEQRHIDNGKPDDPWSCPIALCIKEKLKTENVEVFSHSLKINGFRYVNPDNVYNFIKLFDSGESVGEPFEFIIGESILNI